MIIDLDIFEKKGHKQDKIRMLELLGFEIDDAMRQKIMYEDFLTKAYKDSVGVWTIGVGNTMYDFGYKKVKEGDKITLAEGITELKGDIRKARRQVETLFTHEELMRMGNRRYVLVDLVFNMGLNGVKKFPSMIQALKNQDWDRASKELMYADVEKGILSKYYQQVGQRAKDNVRKLKEG